MQLVPMRCNISRYSTVCIPRAFIVYTPVFNFASASHSLKLAFGKMDSVVSFVDGCESYMFLQHRKRTKKIKNRDKLSRAEPNELTTSELALLLAAL